MSRYIDADILYVDWYDSFAADDGTEYDNIPFISKGQIDDAPTIGIPTWIPCSERLPSESGRYLCTYAEIQRGEYISCIDFGSFINGEWYTSGVIAWMPLPDPYGEREGE